MADNADLNPPICADLDGLDLAVPRQVGTPVEDFNQTLGQLVATLSPDQRTQAIEKLKELAICSSVMADMLGASQETTGLEAPPAPEVEGRDAPSRPPNEKQTSGPPGFPAKAVLSQGTRGVPTVTSAPLLRLAGSQEPESSGVASQEDLPAFVAVSQGTRGSETRVSTLLSRLASSQEPESSGGMTQSCKSCGHGKTTEGQMVEAVVTASVRD